MSDLQKNVFKIYEIPRKKIEKDLKFRLKIINIERIHIRNEHIIGIFSSKILLNLK